MSMTYKEIQDAVIDRAFEEEDRASVKEWIQFRHSWLWDLEDWSFKYAQGPVTFTNASPTAAGPTDLHAILAMFDANGERLAGVSDVRRFFESYNANLSLGSSTPEAYTLVDGAIYLSNPGDGTAGIVVYEKTKPTLAADDSTTGLPDGYDIALVHGGKAEGFKLTNVPLSESFDADFTAAANTLRRAFLSTVKDTGGQFAAYRG